ncbi:P-II family nitrogen regulator [Propionimicrobium sp. PCR01-08-3]|uniref:P-II family nitrogen regulator n=1 Tax=Propionimicrobium sp. PCR01-08-3 TaxID=3052086 RepID=UPI00255C8992|nr:P-II family nitrogen regulator [Propionimicrobium sp. PCR01-08-3]WIY82072.1 P-II family nitrogen regulator [Propionimicrobium sp. PCR01-08-3]
MKLITSVLREDAVDEVQIALAQQGISGMTVSECSGYARQRGHTEVYRGEEFTIDFITKIRMDILSSDEDVDVIVKTICQAARSGSIGDGKIWVTQVEDVVRIRTGERGDSAI